MALKLYASCALRLDVLTAARLLPPSACCCADAVSQGATTRRDAAAQQGGGGEPAGAATLPDRGAAVQGTIRGVRERLYAGRSIWGGAAASTAYQGRDSGPVCKPAESNRHTSAAKFIPVPASPRAAAVPGYAFTP